MNPESFLNNDTSWEDCNTIYDEIDYMDNVNEMTVDSDVSIVEKGEKSHFNLNSHPRPQKKCGAVGKLRSPLEIRKSVL